MPVALGEIEALWAAVFGEPPPISAPPDLLLDVLFGSLPPPPPWTLGAHAADEIEPPPDAPALPLTSRRAT